MRPEAITKARSRLEKAKGHLELYLATGAFEGLDHWWNAILMEGNASFTALGKGASDNSKSRQWFGAKKRERRTDPLLSYMFQARNAAEHGLDPLLEEGAEIRGFAALASAYRTNEEIWKTEKGVFVKGINKDDGSEMMIHIAPPDAMLLPVRDDRYDDTFDPPTEHLSQPLKSTVPEAIAALWLDYLEKTIDEAENLLS